VKLRAVVLLAVSILIIPTSVRAQPADESNWRMEAFGNVGYGRLMSGDSVWGEGIEFGGGIGFRPFVGALSGLGFEARFTFLAPGSTVNASGSSELDTRSFIGTATYQFRRRHAGVAPFVAGGLARLRVNYQRRCDGCVFDVDPITGGLVPRTLEEGVDASKTGVAFGGGVTIALPGRVFVKPEILVVDTTAGSGWNWGALTLQTGVGLRF
jgi:opacity protein-like surface antigen